MTSRTQHARHSTVHRANRRRRTAAAALTLGCFVVTSCSSPSAQDDEVSAVGENGSVGSIDLLSIALVGSEEGEPARFLGTLENESDEPVDVTMADDDEEIVVTVPGGEVYSFEDNEVLFESVSDAPGANATVTASTGTESVELDVPVRDGTLEQYREYLPE